MDFIFIIERTVHGFHVSVFIGLLQTIVFLISQYKRKYKYVTWLDVTNLEVAPISTQFCETRASRLHCKSKCVIRTSFTIL